MTIRERDVNWAELVLLCDFADPREVKNAMQTIRQYKMQCEAEKARVARLMQEETQS